MKHKIICFVGTRPNFMKVAPLYRLLRGRPEVETLLVHTGQHFDRQMSQTFFDELGLPVPDLNLGVHSGSSVERTAEILRRLEPILQHEQPGLALVVGDVDSTFAAALAAVKHGIPVAHVEAGLRSFDRTMPEEINRLLTDAISDLLFVTEPSGLENLQREGIAAEKIFLVGNVMIDTLLQHRARAAQSGILQDLALAPQAYALLTLHRPGNVDQAAALQPLLRAIHEIQREWPVLFPIHPRTRKNIEALGLAGELATMPNLRCVDPLGYLDFLCLMDNARVVLTDSGGIQEETTVLGVPCLTLRANTERPVTLTQGTNRLAGCQPESILRAFRAVATAPARQTRRVPDLWDGRAAERIVAVVSDQLAHRP